VGIERARVVEVHSTSSATARVCSGYLVGDNLVLTAGGQGPAEVRPASTAVWCPANRVWSAASGDVAILEIDDPSAAMAPPGPLRWGQVSGRRPVAVTALGFPPASLKPKWFRDAEQFFGHLLPEGGAASDESLAVEASAISRVAGDGLNGAALFAGADLVGVLVAHAGSERLRARPVSALAADPSFVERVSTTGQLDLTTVSSPAFGPIF
jgi:hypothetical protein